ncbi:hypothetical protein QWZ13_18255 [Reinekea marina]|nr:hypothetical protein [Reinekea marina]MDN3650854.1 hypothetical protein [Reinekea marina]
MSDIYLGQLRSACQVSFKKHFNAKIYGQSRLISCRIRQILSCLRNSLT